MIFKRKGKEIKRRIFGFPCDVSLILTLKLLINKIPAPIYPSMEHIAQLGASGVAMALQGEETTKELREHIFKEHLLVPDINTENAFDLKALVEGQLLELKRQEFGQVTAELVKICDWEDINPWFLIAISKSMLNHLRERRRTRNDIPNRRQSLENLDKILGKHRR